MDQGFDAYRKAYPEPPPSLSGACAASCPKALLQTVVD